MVALYKLKALRLLRLGSPHSSFSNIVASSIIRFVVGDVKSSHFPLQNPILCRHINSEMSEIQPNFAVNYLIHSSGLSSEGAVSASKWVKFRSPDRADSVLSFLRNHGFSATQISKMVRSFPNLLELHPEKNLLPKLEFFTSFGVSKGDLAKILAYGPKLLATSLEKRIPLMNLLSQKNVVSVLRRGSWIFAEGHPKKVAPNIEVLKKNQAAPALYDYVGEETNASNGFFSERDGVVIKNDCNTAIGPPLQFGEEIVSKVFGC